MSAKEVEATAKPSFMEKFFAGIERVGNKVPSPPLMFSYLIIGVIVLSAVLSWIGVSVTEEIAVPIVDGKVPDYYEKASQHWTYKKSNNTHCN